MIARGGGLSAAGVAAVGVRRGVAMTARGGGLSALGVAAGVRGVVSR
jgi:hypothetical protein